MGLDDRLDAIGSHFLALCCPALDAAVKTLAEGVKSCAAAAAALRADSVPAAHACPPGIGGSVDGPSPQAPQPPSARTGKRTKKITPIPVTTSSSSSSQQQSPTATPAPVTPSGSASSSGDNRQGVTTAVSPTASPTRSNADVPSSALSSAAWTLQGSPGGLGGANSTAAAASRADGAVFVGNAVVGARLRISGDALSDGSTLSVPPAAVPKLQNQLDEYFFKMNQSFRSLVTTLVERVFQVACACRRLVAFLRPRTMSFPFGPSGASRVCRVVVPGRGEVSI